MSELRSDDLASRTWSGRSGRRANRLAPAANDDDAGAFRRLAEDAAFGLLRRSPRLSAFDAERAIAPATAGAVLAILAALATIAPAAAYGATSALAAMFFLVAVGFRAALFAAGIGAESRPIRPDAPADEALPVVTILLPVHSEKDGLPLLAEAMSRLDYPREKLDFKLLLEPDDRETIEEARRLKLEKMFEFVVAPDVGPRTKPKACNAGLARARGDLVVIYDAEDEPEPDQLRKAAAAFAGADLRLACLQARLNFYNRGDNLLTALFALEYALWFDFLLPGLQRLRLPIPLGGTSNVFRADVLRAVGGWDPYNVTEDADLGLRLARHGYRTEVLDSTTFEEANCRLGGWLRQRSRWMKGYMQTWLVHRRGGGRRGGAWGVRGLLVLHLFIAGNFIGALIAPILIILTMIALAAGLRLPAWIAALDIAALLAGNLLIAALAAAAPARRGWVSLLPCAALAPFYWLLASIGAWMGLFDLFLRPHYWEKTRHVVSRAAKERRAAALGAGGGVASGVGRP
jgi:cellulose synthase/poly-beta-1,6-N-acetylglucosamine synthase-like glycosyltransferase